MQSTWPHGWRANRMQETSASRRTKSNFTKYRPLKPLGSSIQHTTPLVLGINGVTKDAYHGAQPGSSPISNLRPFISFANAAFPWLVSRPGGCVLHRWVMSRMTVSRVGVGRLSSGDKNDYIRSVPRSNYGARQASSIDQHPIPNIPIILPIATLL